MAVRVAPRADQEVGLVGLLGVEAHRLAVLGQDDRLGRAGLRRGDRAEQLLEALVEAVAELPAEPDDGAVGGVPAVDVREERVAGRAADRLLGADDVPAERLVAVEVPLVDVADVAARRSAVHAISSTITPFSRSISSASNLECGSMSTSTSTATSRCSAAHFT